jgi:hypothetical protein
VASTEATPADVAPSPSTYWYNDQVRIVEDTSELAEEELAALVEDLRSATDA